MAIYKCSQETEPGTSVKTCLEPWISGPQGKRPNYWAALPLEYNISRVARVLSTFSGEAVGRELVGLGCANHSVLGNKLQREKLDHLFGPKNHKRSMYDPEAKHNSQIS